MKMIVVSDTHLTNKFDQDKFDFFMNLFNKCDQLVINGDFWSCYSITFDEFVNSEWKKLFPVMLSKKAVYVYGNHDQKEFMDQRVNLFSIKQYAQYEYKTDNNTYHIEHGHRFFKHQSISNLKFMQLNRKLKIDEKIRKPLEEFLLKSIGINKLVKIFAFMNNRIKSKEQRIFNTHKVLVTGHTHLPESDLKLGFINTGFIDYGFAWYLEIDNQGFELKSSKY